nr:MAG TPA: hypothetical protein [Caudoviricetes sp.]
MSIPLRLFKSHTLAASTYSATSAYVSPGTHRREVRGVLSFLPSTARPEGRAIKGGGNRT